MRRSPRDAGAAASVDWVSRYAAKVRTAEAAITEVASGFVHIDLTNEMGVVGIVEDPEKPEHEEIVCIGRYFVNRATNIAEVSYLVRDDFQHRGIGSFLVRYLARIARENGVAGFDAEVLSDNAPAMKVLHRLGYPVETVVAAGNYQLRVMFGRPPGAVPG